ncbi:hypothetical protein LTR62_004448 [Meristemomyces frigidus]|uniref:ER-bound oxygenase mpaB/mpaB'/Rubber oxygenase catalytic domain-containing protein n=1 Tax=Meristemomyces frigidus TaxID=1508187 RepID=A0AAN7TH76_9PEZI|nr:hypothetical protein LTR62_004448 [Meristemomyces frigidus]
MAWPNPFYRRTPNTRECWGYTFELTDEHLTPEECEPLKHSYDVLGEQVLDRLNELSPPPKKDLPRGNSRFVDAKDVVGQEVHNDGVPKAEEDALEDKDKADEKGTQNIKDASDEKGTQKMKDAPRDLYVILQDHLDNDELLQRFWKEATTVPAWVDWEQIARGQDVFYRYGAANLTGLAYQSLLGGMGAARVVETLARTGGFSTKVARSRLFETTQHILQCTKSVESIQPGGDGFASTIRVRLLHAAVRNRIFKLAESKPSYYDVQAWGIPINDLDSMGTISTFSATLIWLSLPRQGIYLRQQEIADYVALWRYIAHVIGCPTDRFATAAQAKRMMEALLLYEIRPTETSKIMANNIIKSLEHQPPGYASADFLTASARWLNGNDLCDELGLMRPGIYYWTLMAGQCLFFSLFAYTYRFAPTSWGWDRRHIDMLKKAFYQIIVHTKYGLKGEESRFEFKYVPEYETITEMGEGTGDQGEGKGGIERRNFRTFVLGVGGWGWGVGVGVWIGVGVVRRVWGLF